MSVDTKTEEEKKTMRQTHPGVCRTNLPGDGPDSSDVPDVVTVPRRVDGARGARADVSLIFHVTLSCS
ncbi:hypothetical protein F2P81_024581 [Scophthalmus maximus]|uniref:Uncharacterized protein n=1 Tax=Scophthalmus maximus TaxID=52904 RepID=A0A6A4RY02_SCOMX|nr:hypothetical protein F2P81_024581 [Scophthalmus maximus]